MLNTATEPTKSAGHLTFVALSSGAVLEYYALGDNVMRAPVANAFDTDGRRHGRWAGPLSHWDRYRDQYMAGRR